MERILEIEGCKWRVLPLRQGGRGEESEPWHFVRVRFEPLPPSSWTPREAWLRVEEEAPREEVLSRYGDEELREAFLVAEEVRLPGSGAES
ncbi:MAG: hypothetical protein ACE5HP_06365 [Gemmatimonadota bacterium]